MQNPGFTTTLEGDKLAVSMTDGGHLTISKNEGELQVDTLFTDLNKPHEKVVKTFHLSETGEWVAEHEELYSYLEDGFSEYLNMLVDLDVDDGQQVN
ncbi:hypothetical protein QBZ16_000201 [Prototheca wickerhamii]|uniref:Uncharacterized protein n=1 Tax=Prototheca wickerhamii TaxID=3111 RepID=A0AAD9IL49_PROWI|nr:hypothetical protein QBZ16_000201 [Prototheca wickerhamii]